MKNVVDLILSKDLTDDISYTHSALTRLFVLSHFPALPRYQWSWIDMARRGRVDPGNLTSERIDEFMDAIALKLWPFEKVAVIFYIMIYR